MDLRRAAQGLAIGRIAFGAGLVLAPRGAGLWLGRDATAPAASVLARALGARDLVLGGMVLHTLGHPEVAPRWVATCGAVDAVDGLAGLAARRDLPAVRGALGVVTALGSAGAGLALARALRAQGDAEPPGPVAQAAAQARDATPEPPRPDVVMPEGAEANASIGARTIGVGTAIPGGIGSGTGGPSR